MVYESREALSPDFCDSLVAKLKTRMDCKNISVDPNFANEDNVVLKALGEHLQRYLDSMTEQGFKMNSELGDTGYFVGIANGNVNPVWDQNRSPYRIITFVFYLDDADNSETVFNFCDKTIKPTKGKFMAFPSSWRNLHMTKVKSGECFFIIGDVYVKQPLSQDKCASISEH